MRTSRKSTLETVGIGHNAPPFAAKLPCDYQINLKSPADLRPNPKNPRTHTKRKIRDLTEAIRTVGFVTPIIVDQTGMILAGHARWEAAKLLGLFSIPTICASATRQEHLDIFVLGDNKFAERAGWDR